MALHAFVTAFSIAASISVCAEIPIAVRDDRYVDMTDDFSCAKANQANQRQSFPNWPFGQKFSRGNSADAIENNWEPVLESVDRCNGLDAGWTKKFSFLVVLDASWVKYYGENTAHFASQGYPTLLESPNLLLSRVSYLFQKQFGAVIAARKVVSLPNLGEACATNNQSVDDGTYATSTSAQLGAAGIASQDSDAGIIRLGVGSYTKGQYCHSSSPVGQLCQKTMVLTTQRKPFKSDGSGSLNYITARVLAHELAHFFGVCHNSNPHCLHSHSINELADIQVWNGNPAFHARPEGMFSKFMITCSPLYEDTVCYSVSSASARCGVVAPPPSLAGEYVNTKYGAKSNNWHFVTITETMTGSVYRWTNKARRSWDLTRDASNALELDVSPSCPYYSMGYRTAAVETSTDELGNIRIVGVYGPWNELYQLKSEVDPWNTVFCPHGYHDTTCWADSAYQKCSANRQGAYNAVMAEKTSGLQAMYNKYTELLENQVGCTSA